MAAGPQRRTERRKHLDASVVPVEKALLARAGAIGSHLDVVRQAARVHGLTDEALVGVIADAVAEIVAAEFRAMADELHHWG